MNNFPFPSSTIGRVYALEKAGQVQYIPIANQSEWEGFQLIMTKLGAKLFQHIDLMADMPVHVEIASFDDLSPKRFKDVLVGAKDFMLKQIATIAKTELGDNSKRRLGGD